jgi:hypothetical protein
MRCGICNGSQEMQAVNNANRFWGSCDGRVSTLGLACDVEGQFSCCEHFNKGLH